MKIIENNIIFPSANGTIGETKYNDKLDSWKVNWVGWWCYRRKRKREKERRREREREKKGKKKKQPENLTGEK